MSNQHLESKVLQVTQNLEQHLDAAIENLDNLDVNDLEQLRKQRMQELKVQRTRRQEWLQNGHGGYEQLAEEKMFFDSIKKSDNVVVHFFTPTNTRSPIVDKHLKLLAPKHMETKFVSLNAERCPFLAERLKIKTIPTLICVHNTVIVDKIVGFTSLGNRDDFTTEVLEWRLAQNKVIDYEGDLTTPPDQQEKKEKLSVKKGIRSGVYNGESDDDLDLVDYSNQFKDQDLNYFQGQAKYNQNYLTPEEEAELGLDEDDDTKK